jgi:diguanylate cyclase (GGDEF)-like protein/PAS domain S-box-containing protein
MIELDTPQPVQSSLQPLLAHALTHVANPIFITDQSGKIVWVNEAFCQVSGYTAEEALGSTPAMLQSGRQSPASHADMWQTIRSGRVWHGEVVDQRKDGSTYRADEVITPLRDAKGAVSHFIAVQHDITQREKEYQHERYLAYHDQLTGLPNRAMLRDIQQKVLAHAMRTQQLVAFMFVDLDGFKPVNDRLGHNVGDHLLAAVADRMRTGIRQSDTIARVGGDEFAVLVSGLDGRETAELLARKLLDALSRPFVMRGEKFSISASIGIAMFPADGANGDALLVHADRAMYQAKLLGGNRSCFYDRSFAAETQPVLPRTQPP